MKAPSSRRASLSSTVSSSAKLTSTSRSVELNTTTSSASAMSLTSSRSTLLSARPCRSRSTPVTLSASRSTASRTAKSRRSRASRARTMLPPLRTSRSRPRTVPNSSSASPPRTRRRAKPRTTTWNLQQRDLLRRLAPMNAAADLYIIIPVSKCFPLKRFGHSDKKIKHYSTAFPVRYRKAVGETEKAPGTANDSEGRGDPFCL